MSASIGKYAASKFMSKKSKEDEAHRLEDGRDPYWYLETDKHGRTKKKAKKSAKHYPAYIPLEDRERLNSFRGWAKFMDTALFGQVGASFFVGLVPLAGDFADGGISFLLVQKYANTISCGLPKSVYAKMMSNITVDVAIGFVPVLGDIADAIWKANVKNLILLEDYLKKAFAPKSGGAGHAGIGEPMRQVGNGRDAAIAGTGAGAVRHQEPVVQKQSKTGGFFGLGSKNNRTQDRHDVEMVQHDGRADARDYRRDDRMNYRNDDQETGTVRAGRR